jgi:hypothetical protein
LIFESPKDIIQAAHQQVTRQWWAGRERFDIFVPRAVVAEARRGDATAVNRIDYLLTWNLRHLANAVLRGKIEEAVRAAGLVAPIICTPEELMEPKP